MCCNLIRSEHSSHARSELQCPLHFWCVNVCIVINRNEKTLRLCGLSWQEHGLDPQIQPASDLPWVETVDAFFFPQFITSYILSNHSEYFCSTVCSFHFVFEPNVCGVFFCCLFVCFCFLWESQAQINIYSRAWLKYRIFYRQFCLLSMGLV